MQGLFLIGPPGSGKTTLLSPLGQALQKNILDTDKWIADQHQQSIAEIYESRGEAFLIQEEERCLRSHDLRNLVIASSGSVVYTGAKEYVRSVAIVIWLDVPPKDTISFLEGDDYSDRILLGGAPMLNNLQRRQALYKEWSSYRLLGKSKSIEETVREILEVWLPE